MPPAKISDECNCGGGIKNREVANAALSIAKDNRECIRKIQNRPPVWATVVISVLTFALGSSLSFTYTYIRLIDRINPPG